MLTYISDPERHFKQAQISGVRQNDGSLLLDIADHNISEGLKEALELDKDGVTRFATFRRLG